MKTTTKTTSEEDISGNDTNKTIQGDTTKKQRSVFSTTLIVSCVLAAVVVVTCCMHKEEHHHHHNPQHPDHDHQPSPIINPPVITTPEEERGLRLLEGGNNEKYWSETEEEEMMDMIKSKLVPHQFDFIDGTDTLSPHQFLHLHHMKTGGTSIDHLLKCAMGRLERTKQWEVPYYSIHECAVGSFNRCLESDEAPCREKMNESAIMSFCAPLKHLDTFGWTESNIKAMTILRNPIDRVWSMYRFQTKKCYHCRNLTDIYENVIDNGQTNDWSDLCLKQLQNHETVNLLRKDFPSDATEDEMVEEAINNMKNFFTVIGLTERLQETYELVGEVFPWMALQIEHSNNVCRLPHDNTSPKNNYCIPDENPKKQGHNWELPAHADEATRQAILEHNRMDMKLYQAAQQYFELQMRAAKMGDEA